MTDEQPGRLARLWKAADARNVPLRTIVATVAVVAVAYMAGKLIYRLRDILLLVVVAGFLALLLNPLVVLLQRHPAFRRRGIAVSIVSLLTVLVFTGLVLAFGLPLVNGITALAHSLPAYLAKAEHGQGWIGHIVRKYHIQTWVQRNVPKLVGYAQNAVQAGPGGGQGRRVPGHRALHDLRPGPAAAPRGPEDAALAAQGSCLRGTRPGSAGWPVR